MHDAGKKRCGDVRSSKRSTKANMFIIKNVNASPISSCWQNEIAHSIYRQIFYYVRYASGRTHYLNMSIMPLVNLLVIAPFTSAEFHESVSRICLANANVEACLPAPLHPAAIIAMYNRFTVRRSCATISVNYYGRRGECIRAPGLLLISPIHHITEK